jgi:LEA14-like dessication related protein
LLAFGAVLVSAVLGCDELQSPQIVGEGVSTGKITTQGADVEATLSVYNPNRNTLTANGIDSKVTIGGKPNVARAVVAEALVMPGGQRVKIKMPMRVEWTDPAALSALAATKQPADYTVEGIVHFAGKGGALQTPFQIKGAMTATELAQASGVATAAPSAKPSR